MAVIVSMDYDDASIDAAEEQEDRAELRRAQAESDYISWEVVKAELGLD